MKLPPFAALVLSAAIGSATVAAAVPPLPLGPAGVQAIPAGATCVTNSNSKNWQPITGECSIVIVQPRERRHDNQVRRVNRRADCHRDVRAHRINGVTVLHRHVGDDCEIREVRSN